jgi:hypothetical protein
MHGRREERAHRGQQGEGVIVASEQMEHSAVFKEEEQLVTDE